VREDLGPEVFGRIVVADGGVDRRRAAGGGGCPEALAGLGRDRASDHDCEKRSAVSDRGWRRWNLALSAGESRERLGRLALQRRRRMVEPREQGLASRPLTEGAELVEHGQRGLDLATGALLAAYRRQVHPARS
jgi:hypothetical protein